MTWYAWVMVVILALAILSAGLYATGQAKRDGPGWVEKATVITLLCVALLIGVVALATRGDC